MGAFNQRPGYGQSLLLASGYISAALGNRRIKALFHLTYKFPGLCDFSCLGNLPGRCLLFAVAYIGIYIPGKQNGFLRHIVDIAAQLLLSQILNGNAVQGNFTFSYIVESGNQVDQGSFSGTGGTDDGGSLSRPGNEGNIMKGVVPAPLYRKETLRKTISPCIRRPELPAAPYPEWRAEHPEPRLYGWRKPKHGAA